MTDQWNSWTSERVKALQWNSWDSARVKALREALGLTQEGLARKIDVSLSTVQAWEAGRYVPSPLAQMRLNNLEVYG